MNRLSNENVTVYLKDKCISIRDLTDHYNGTAGYTRKVRNINKGWDFVNEIFGKDLKGELKFWDVVNALDMFKLDVHTYCSID